MQRRLLAVVGATGTGKTALGIHLARRFGGEVVNADPYSFYRGMDIGTAKPTSAERSMVPHHLFDVANPDDTITLRRYLDLAHEVLDDIWSRNSLPVLVGGSGQYVWALIEGWQVPRVAPSGELRAELENLVSREGIASLHARLAELDPEAARRIDARNPRRLIRAYEVVSQTGLPLSSCQTREPLDADVLVIGLRLPRDALDARLDLRVDGQVAAGLLDEVISLRAAGFGEASPVRGGIAYREVSEHLDGLYGLDEAVRRIKVANHRLSRRQSAWFKQSDARINWLSADQTPEREADALVDTWLSADATTKPGAEVA